MAWHHGSKNQQDFYVDSQECEQTAVQMYPPAIVTSQPADTGRTRTSCQQTLSGMECESRPAGITTFNPWQSYDANAQVRVNAINACLLAKGYRYGSR